MVLLSFFLPVTPLVTNRMKEIQRLSEDDKTTVTKIIDAFIRDTKAKKAYS